jgi:hypothetical protein
LQDVKYPLGVRIGELNPWTLALLALKNPSLSVGNDAMPSWIKAKKSIARDWKLVEEVAGNREEIIQRISRFSLRVSLPTNPLTEGLPK